MRHLKICKKYFFGSLSLAALAFIFFGPGALAEKLKVNLTPKPHECDGITKAAAIRVSLGAIESIRREQNVCKKILGDILPVESNRLHLKDADDKLTAFKKGNSKPEHQACIAQLQSEIKTARSKIEKDFESYKKNCGGRAEKDGASKDLNKP